MALDAAAANKQLTDLWKDKTLLTLDTARKKYILYEKCKCIRVLLKKR